MLLGEAAQQHLPCIRVVAPAGVVGQLEELGWRGINGLPLMRIASCEGRCEGDRAQQDEERQR